MTKKIPELVSGLLSGNPSLSGGRKSKRKLSMMEQAVKAGTNAAMYRNPIYRGYQDAISLLRNKSNGLLTRPNANGGGVTLEEMLKNLSNIQLAPTVTQKICVQKLFRLKSS